MITKPMHQWGSHEVRECPDEEYVISANHNSAPGSKPRATIPPLAKAAVIIFWGFLLGTVAAALAGVL